MPTVRNIRVSGGGFRNSNDGGNRGHSSSPAGIAGNVGMLGLLGRGAKDFFSSMGPGAALAGGLVTAGYATKEVVKQGRELKKMEIIMKSASEGVEGVNTATEHWQESMKYVRSEAHRLGQDVYEMGMGFAKMQQAVKGKLSWNDRKTLFTGLAELSTTYGLNQDDQKGVWRALTQMFTKGKIEAEEEGQLAERGLPAKEMIKAATKRQFEAEGKKFNDAIYNKMRQKGELKMQDIAPYLGQIASEIANNNGALDEALQTSLVGQMRMKNAIREASKDIMDSGLDKLLFQLFEIITKLVPLFKSLATTIIGAVSGFLAFIKGVKDFVKEHPFLTGGLVGMIALFKALRMGMLGVSIMAPLMGARVVASFLAMGKAAKRFAPLLLLYALFEIFKAYDRYLKGDDNWMKTVALLFEYMYASVDYYLARMKLAWLNAKEWFGEIPNTIAKTMGKSIPLVGATQVAMKMFNPINDNSVDRTANNNMNRNAPTRGTPVVVNNQNDIYLPDGFAISKQKITNTLNMGGLPNVGAP